jgi:hypothetical protein
MIGLKRRIASLESKRRAAAIQAPPALISAAARVLAAWRVAKNDERKKLAQ